MQCTVILLMRSSIVVSPPGMTGVVGKLPTPPLATPELDGCGVPAGVPAGIKMTSSFNAIAQTRNIGNAKKNLDDRHASGGRLGSLWHHGEEITPVGCLLPVAELGKGGMSAGLPCKVFRKYQQFIDHFMYVHTPSSI